MEKCETVNGNMYPVTAALKVIGGKWRIPIIWKLANGPVRYNELKKTISWNYEYHVNALGKGTRRT